MCTRRRRLLALAAMLACAPASATKYWVGGNGYWDIASNWSNTDGGAGGAGRPAAGEGAYVRRSTSFNCWRDNSTGDETAPGPAWVVIDGLGGAIATLQQFGLTDDMYSGDLYIGYDGVGQYQQTGGTNTTTHLYIGDSSVSTGTYSLNNATATLSTAYLYNGWGGRGYFNLTAGIVTASSSAYVSAPNTGSSVWSQTGGYFSTPNLYMGNYSNDVGRLVLGGGSINVGTNLFIGATTLNSNAGGTANLTISGGGLRAGTIMIGRNGSITLSGGSLSETNAIVVDGGTFTRSGGGGYAGGDIIARNSGLFDFSDYVGGFLMGSNLSLVAETHGHIDLSGSGVTVLSGYLGLTGGQISVGSLSSVTTGYCSLYSGTLSVENASATLPIGGTGSVFPSGLMLSQDRTLLNAGTTSVSADSVLILDGGTLQTGRVVNSGSFAFVSGNLRLTAGSLEISNLGLFGSVLDLDASKKLDVLGTGTVSIPGGTLRMSGGTLTLANTLSSNTGRILMDSALGMISGGTINNTGTISGTGRISSYLSNTSGGVIQLNPGDHLWLSKVVNGGTMQLLGGVVETAAGAGNFANSGRIVGRGSILAGDGLTNNGTIVLSGGPSEIFGPFSNASGGSVTITGGAHATFYGSATLLTGSSFKVSTDSIAAFIGPFVGLSYLTGPGTKIFESTASGGPLASLGDTIVETTGALTATAIREDQLIVRGIGSVAVNGTTAATSRLASLSIETGGVLDLNNNDLVIDYTGGTRIAAVRGYLSTGLLRSSTANASGSPKFALGYKENDAGLVTFSGQSVDATTLLVAYTLRGDSNLDGKVNTLDFNNLAGSFGGSGKYWVNGDFDYSSVVNSVDFNYFVANYGNSTTVGAAPPLGAVVPEPATLLLCAPLLLVRRRR